MTVVDRCHLANERKAEEKDCRKQEEDEVLQKSLREVKKSGAVHIVLDCQMEKLRSVLKDAQVIWILYLTSWNISLSRYQHLIFSPTQAVGMMTANHNYLITSLDLHLVDLDDFKWGGTNITAFRLVDPAHPEVL